MPAGVFDFEFLRKRVEELGIDPVYHTVESVREPAGKIVPRCADTGLRCDCTGVQCKFREKWRF